MKIENLKELQKVISVCRRLGVQSIKVDNVEFHLSEQPTVAPKKRWQKDTFSADLPPEAQVPIITDELTDEQRLFWSADQQDSQ